VRVILTLIIDPACSIDSSTALKRCNSQVHEKPLWAVRIEYIIDFFKMLYHILHMYYLTTVGYHSERYKEIKIKNVWSYPSSPSAASPMVP
jgi:hypothetical protein